MNPRRTILEALKKAGFKLVRSGKHEVYSNGEWNVPLPSGNKIGGCTLKAVLQHIEGRGPFFAKQQQNKKSQ